MARDGKRTYQFGDNKARRKKIAKKEEESGEMLAHQVYGGTTMDEIMRMVDANISRFSNFKANPNFQPPFSTEQVTIHAKLEISQPEDAHEKQADDLANAVSENDTSKSQNILNEKPADVQTKGEGGSLSTTPEFDQQLSATKGQGQSLDDATKGKLEQHTGTDLSDVKIHTGSTASTLSEGINAKAFTHGQDIYFKDGNYNPKSPEGEKLLTHEVAHTVQQGNGVGRKVMRQTNKDVRVKDLPVFKNDTNKWTLRKDPESIFIYSDKKYYFLPVLDLQVYQIPENAQIEGKELPLEELVAGAPASGPSGSLVTMARTPQGSVVTMLDAGSKNGSLVYQEQLSGLMARMGIERITHIEIIHNHNDHINRIREVVTTYRVPASNLNISPYFMYSPELRSLYEELSTSSQMIGLGYSRIPSFQVYSPTNPGEFMFNLNFERGTLRYSFYANSSTLAQLSQKATDYMNRISSGNGSEASKPKADLEDAASFIAEITSLSQNVSFKMLVLGDLRGRDYLTLERTLNAAAGKPTAFAEFFQNVTLLYGFNHHLGVVEKNEDLAGIRRILEVTLFETGSLSVIVQTSAPQMRQSLLDALVIIGVDVTVVGSGTAGNQSGALIYSSGRILPYGGETTFYEANQSARRLLGEINTLRRSQRSFENIVENEPTRYGTNTESIREAFKTEIARLTAIREAIYELAMGNQKTLSKRSTGNSGIPGTTLHRIEELYETIDTGRESEVFEKTRLTEEEINEGELLEYWNQMVEEFNESLARAIELNEITPGLRARLFELDPELGENITGMSYEETMAHARRVQMNITGARPSSGTMLGMLRGPRIVKAGSGILAVVQLFNDIAGPWIQKSAEEKKGTLIKSYNELMWFIEVRLDPVVNGVITHWYGEDEIITDETKAAELFSKNELDYLLLKGIKKETYVNFLIWLDANVNTLDDFLQYFSEDPVFETKEDADQGPVIMIPADTSVTSIADIADKDVVKGDYNFEKNKWFVKKYYWDYEYWNEMKFTYEYDDKLTKIMNLKARRIIERTNEDMEIEWAESQKQTEKSEPVKIQPLNFVNPDLLKNVTVPDQYYFSVAYEPGTPEISADKIKRKVVFKDPDKRNAYQVEKPADVLRSVWTDGTPVFFELEGINIPNGYVAVKGATYNTLVNLRTIKSFTKNKYPRVYRYKKYSDVFWQKEQEMISKIGWDAYAAENKTDAYYIKFIINGTIKREFIAEESDTTDGYFIFPGDYSNSNGFALVKRDDIRNYLPSDTNGVSLPDVIIETESGKSKK